MSKIIKRVGKIIFNGSEAWNIATNVAGTKIHIHTTAIKDGRSGHYQHIICDKFNTVRISWDTAPPYTVCTSNAALCQVGFNFDAGTYTLDTWKTWLRSNPVTVYYELAKSIEIPIDTNLCISQYEDGSLMMDGGVINPTIDFNYSTSLASATDIAKDFMSANSTAINVQQGRIETLVSNTTIVKDGKTTQLKDAYAGTVIEVGNIKTAVGDMTTTIGELGTVVSNHTSAITQNASDIELKVSAAEVQATLTQAVDAAVAISVDGILLTVSEAYISKDDEQKLIDKASSTAISQNAEAVSIEFNKTVKLVNDVEGKLEEEINSRKSYIRFVDGAIHLGVAGSEFTASLDNDSLDFKQGDDIVAQITNKKMLITDAEIRNKLTLGESSRGYFDFLPRANGNLSLKWRAS